MYQLQQEMARLQMEMQRLGMQPQQAPFKVVMKKQDFDIQADDATAIRFLEPPLKFDEKGNPVRYSAEELKKLKGNTNLPGYPGEFEVLHPGHVVKVTVGPRQPAAKGKDLDKAPVESDLPYARMILVTGEEAPPAAGKKKK
jgi:hypothetical protein